MTAPDLKSHISEAAETLADSLFASKRAPRAFVGLDGFIDEIVQVVDQRVTPTQYTPVRTITDYAHRLAGAAGKSTNVEFVIQQIKMGGNGPLMADAMGALGTKVNYVGALGWPMMNPTFDPLKRWGSVASIADPGVTTAAEFDDGKIMHGKLQTLSEITYPNMVERLGGQGVLDSMMAEADIVAMVNWTMIPHLTSVWRDLSDRLAEAVGDKGPDFIFFDLCDPQKRSREDLRECVEVISSFGRTKATPILGLNEKESEEVCEALSLPYGESDGPGLIDRARRIADASGIGEIVIHPRTFASAYGADGEGTIQGPMCAAPKLTTGAGDHFNGGYCFARLLGLEPRRALAIGKAVSGFYVREGRGPTAKEIGVFCERWVAGTLDPWVGV